MKRQFNDSANPKDWAAQSSTQSIPTHPLNHSALRSDRYSSQNHQGRANQGGVNQGRSSSNTTDKADQIDRTRGTNRRDVLRARKNRAQLFGGRGSDRLFALGSNNRLFGEQGNDFLDASGGKGRNRIFGGEGNDTLIVGRNDTAHGGDGNDRFYVSKRGLGGSQLTGGDGLDQFWVANGKLPNAPTIINDFNVEQDQIGISGLYRVNEKGEKVRRINSIGEDIRVTQRGRDTVINVVTSPLNLPFQSPRETTQEIAILKNTEAGLISPLFVLDQFYQGVNKFVASFTDNNPNNDGDFSGIKAVLADDVVWELGGPTDKLSWSGQRVGSAAVQDFFTRVGSEVLFEGFRREGAVVQGNVVASLAAERTRVYATNQVYVTGAIDLFETKNGKISHGSIVLDTFPIVQTYQGSSRVNEGIRSPMTIDGNANRQFVPTFSGRTGIQKRNSILFDRPARNLTTRAIQTFNAANTARTTPNTQALNPFLANDVRWFSYGPQDITPAAGERTGQAGVRDYFEQTAATVTQTAATPDIVLTDGDRVVIAANVQERAKVVTYSGNTLVPVIDPATRQQQQSPEFRNVRVQLLNFDRQGQIQTAKEYLDSFPIVQARLNGRPFTVGQVTGLGYTVPADLQDFLRS